MADWTAAARQLAVQVAAEAPEWYDAVADTPRHLLVPRWWEIAASDYPPNWRLVTAMRHSPYVDETLVTQIGTFHADHAAEPDSPSGAPTSSSTLPGLIVRLLHLLDPRPGQRVLDVGTGSGFSAALLGHRLGDDHVTSVDRESYLVEAARERLAAFGRTPAVEVVDATTTLPPGDYDRIMATVSVRPVPQVWLEALRPGGRLVTTIAQTSLLISAEKDPDGVVRGRVQPHPASFMQARRTGCYSPRLDQEFAAARDTRGEESRAVVGCVPDLWADWELRCLYELHSPDIEHRSATHDDGSRVVWLLGADGSWARAEESTGIVHQSGPRRLWQDLESIQARWNRADRFPLDRLTVELTADQSLLLGPDESWRFEL